jgi:putative hydrolase of the HAD superfamily
MVEHDVDPTAFMNYVHDIDLTLVAPDPALDEALGRLDGRKVIFTNASTRHAENVLERLGVHGHFAEIFDIAAANYVPKPQPEAYRMLVERHRIDPARAVFVEDLAINLAPAAALGMTTVWVAPDGERQGETGADHVDHVIEDLVAWLRGVIDEAGTGGR